MSGTYLSTVYTQSLLLHNLLVISRTVHCTSLKRLILAKSVVCVCVCALVCVCECVCVSYLISLYMSSKMFAVSTPSYFHVQQMSPITEVLVIAVWRNKYIWILCYAVSSYGIQEVNSTPFNFTLKGVSLLGIVNSVAVQ